MKVMYLITVLSIVVSSEALDYRLCQEPPKEKHCLIEYPVRYRWPHQVRYVFNWYTKKCFEIRWSQHCHLVFTKSANNFPSERECLEECSGWA